MLDEQIPGLQIRLDQLLREGRTLFKLTGGALAHERESQYSVDFHDSRFHSVWFEWKEGQSIREVFRAAVLERVKKGSGPLHW